MVSKFRYYYDHWLNYKQGLKESNRLKFWIVDWVETIVVCLAVVMVIRTYILQTSLVYSGSMIPTMHVRDRLFVNKFIYRFVEPERGDIVLFKSPYGDRRQYVKRLIGLPGERVKVEKGVAYINDAPLVLPGVNLQRDYSYMDEVTIPDGHYFVLGDNRGNSADSRSWGFVPADELLGKAWFTFWPVSRMQLLR